MPFIEEEKFKLFQEDLDNAKLKREAAENELSQTQEAFSSFKKKSKVTPIILGLLLGAFIAATYYFYTNGGGSTISDSEITALKKKEAVRVLDSINRAQVRAKRNNNDVANTNTDSSNIDVDKTVADVKSNTSGETIYSVQIGVFSKKKYPLLSSKTIPSTVSTANGYFKYSLGLFKTLNEAKYLRNELKKVGFKDAFVASYVDGKRQKIHH